MQRLFLLGLALVFAAPLATASPAPQEDPGLAVERELSFTATRLRDSTASYFGRARLRHFDDALKKKTLQRRRRYQS